MSLILELHSSDLVSFVISDRLVLSMVMDMLDYAARQLAPPGGPAPILRSDQGWQYQHKHYQKKLNDYGIIQKHEPKREVSGQCFD